VRASEARRPDSIIDDPMAIELADSIDYDFAKFGFARRQDMAVRALGYDRQTRRYLLDHPKATVVALAEGLQTSFYRLDASGVGNQFRWLTVDLPPMIELRRKLLPPSDRVEMLAQSALAQLTEIYRGQGRTFEMRQPLLAAGPAGPGGSSKETEFGAIRVGVSTLLIRDDLREALGPAVSIAFAALAVSVLGATLLAQLLLRPIHVIRSGLTRLGQGEFGVRLDLSQHDEFGELGTFFNAMSAQLSADRSQMAGQVANLESAVEHLQDAVAIVNGRGELLFANPAMRTLLPTATAGASFNDLLPPDHPVRRLSEQTLMSRQSRGPARAGTGCA